MPLADVVTLLIAIDGGTVIGVETACTVMAAALAFEASALDVAVTVTVPAVTPVTLPAASTVATAAPLVGPLPRPVAGGRGRGPRKTPKVSRRHVWCRR